MQGPEQFLLLFLIDVPRKVVLCAWENAMTDREIDWEGDLCRVLRFEMTFLSGIL
jgi:hypothetical protein